MCGGMYCIFLLALTHFTLADDADVQKPLKINIWNIKDNPNSNEENNQDSINELNTVTRSTTQQPKVIKCPTTVRGQSVCKIEDVKYQWTQLPNTSCFFFKPTTKSFSLNVLEIFVFALLLSISAILNLYLVYACCKVSTYHTISFHLCIGNIAVCDFLSVVVFFVEDAAKFQKPANGWPLGEIACLCTTTVMNAVFPVIIVCVCLMLIERYTEFCRPDLYSRLFAKQKMNIYLFLVWLLASGRSFFFLYLTTYKSCPLADGSLTHTCRSDKWTSSAMSITFAIDFMLSYALFLIVCVYFIIKLLCSMSSEKCDEVETIEVIRMLKYLFPMTFVLLIVYRIASLVLAIGRYSLGFELVIGLRLFVYVNGVFKPLIYLWLYRKLYNPIGHYCMKIIKPAPPQPPEQQNSYISDSESDIIGVLQRQHRREMEVRQREAIRLGRSISESCANPNDDILRIEVGDGGEIHMTTSAPMISTRPHETHTLPNRITSRPRLCSTGRTDVPVPIPPMEDQYQMDNLYRKIQQDSLQRKSKQFPYKQQPLMQSMYKGPHNPNFNTLNGRQAKFPMKNVGSDQYLDFNGKKFQNYPNRTIQPQRHASGSSDNPRNLYENRLSFRKDSITEDMPPQVPPRQHNTHRANYENMSSVQQRVMDLDDDTGSSSDTGLGSDFLPPPHIAVSSPMRNLSTTSSDSVLPHSASSLKPLLDERTGKVKTVFNFGTSKV